MRTSDRDRSKRAPTPRAFACGVVALGALLPFGLGAQAQERERLAAEADTVAAAAPMAEPPAVPEAARRGGISPGAALLLGVGATAVPLAVAVYGDGNTATWVGGLTGIIVGPGVGLAAGGRSDLALRGVLIRTVGCGLIAVGGAAFGASFEEDLGSVGTATIIIGGVAAAVTAASMIYDLAITYGATERARARPVSFGVRPDGVVTVTWRF